MVILIQVLSGLWKTVAADAVLTGFSFKSGLKRLGPFSSKRGRSLPFNTFSLAAFQKGDRQ